MLSEALDPEDRSLMLSDPVERVRRCFFNLLFICFGESTTVVAPAKR